MRLEALTVCVFATLALGCVKQSGADDARAGVATEAPPDPRRAAPRQRVEVLTDTPEQLQWSCDAGDAYSCGELSRMYDSGRGGLSRSLPHAAALRAAELYMNGCAGGDQVACSNLAYLYLRGVGVKQDYGRAAGTFYGACDAGEPRACHNLGVLYMNGSGVARKPTTATQLFERACNAGDGRGCSSLATAHFRGLGVPTSHPKALALFRRACDQGEADGCAAIGVMHVRGTGGLEQDVDRGRLLLDQACNAGSPHACQHLGGLYRRGEGVPRDDKRAASLFMIACEGGHAHGCAQLSSMPGGDSMAAHLKRRSDHGAAEPTIDQGKRYLLETLLRGCARGQAQACSALGTHGGVTDPGF
jgi:TPR repeat protein